MFSILTFLPWSLATFLLLWENTTTKATYKRRLIVQRVRAHDHCGGEHGSRQACSSGWELTWWDYSHGPKELAWRGVSLNTQLLVTHLLQARPHLSVLSIISQATTGRATSPSLPRQGFSLYPRTSSVEQFVLELTKICLPISPSAGIKGMDHHCPNSYYNF